MPEVRVGCERGGYEMNVMLDLETMGSGSHAAIVAIGAVEFNPMAMTLGRKFYCLVDLESAVKEGGQMDAGTVIWWLRHGDAARQELAKGGAPMIQALRDFAFWLARSASDPIVWGNGSDFDNVILSSAYRRAGMPVPWRYSSSRCYRTVKNMRKDIVLERAGTHHNALADAESQAVHLMAILKATKGTEAT